MSLFLLYIVKVIACSGILYAYYWCFLRNKMFHHYNRFYLLSAMVLSLLLPLLQIPVGNNLSGEPGMMFQVVQAMDILYEPVVEGSEAITPQTNAMPSVRLYSALFIAANAVYLLYFAGLLFAILLFLRSLRYIRKLSRKYSPEWIGRIRFFMTAEPGTPFSFFRSVFWNDQLPVDSRNGRQVFLHEYYHVQQKHSIDIVLAEVMLALAWFNPFFYLMKKELKAIHEFLADQYASENNNKYEYAQLLVEQAISSKKNRLTHSFFQPQIKRRITMIMRTNQLRYSWILLMLTMANHTTAQAVKQTSAVEKQTAAPFDNSLPIPPLVFDDKGELVIKASSTSSPNDFDFYVGKWKLHNRRLNCRLQNCKEWSEFEASCEMKKVFSNSIANYDVASFGGNPFQGFTVRLFNPKTKLWSLYYTDSKTGVMDPPVVGSFENGVGHFFTKDVYEGKKIIVVFRWDARDPNNPIWSQAFSPDNGKTWEWNWYIYQSRWKE